jgi:branched-chain amino acid transport system substrate-binding protein
MAMEMPSLTHAWAIACLSAALTLTSVGSGQSAEPIKIGFSVQLTGPLAPSGKANLLAQQIWAEEINAKRGLLGRQVQLVYYDDQSTPSTVPGIYAKLLDIDKVDLLMGSASNVVAAAMPTVIERNKLIVTLVALGVNDAFKYPRYFQTAPWGADARSAMSRGFFEVARQMHPPVKSVALVGLDAEAAAHVLDGAREHAKDLGLHIVYDRTYPANTTDFAAIIRAIQAGNPDAVFVASYPLDSVGMIRAARESNLKTLLFGGAMVGLQYASIRTQLGENLNGVVNYELWAPGAKMKFSGIEAFLAKYREQARSAGADPLGTYQPPFAYAAMQVLERAIGATGTLDDGKLAEYIHDNTFQTVVGDVAFDARGEWVRSRVLTVQFQNVKGNGLEQFLGEGAHVILYPPEYRDGEPKPFAK